MVRLPIILLATPLILGSNANLLKRTVATIESDLMNIITQLTALCNALTAFPDSGGSLVNALAIHTDAENLNTAVTTAISDIKATGPVNENDGQVILMLIREIEDIVIHCVLNETVVKKPAFDELPLGDVSALVKSDLISLNASTSELEGALIGTAPADLVSQVTAIKTAIDAAFSTALVAYASA